jgi:ABC-type transport system involved in cytochrome bd biosynthesis fused ATPase/permease subunit
MPQNLTQLLFLVNQQVIKYSINLFKMCLTLLLAPRIVAPIPRCTAGVHLILESEKASCTFLLGYKFFRKVLDRYKLTVYTVHNSTHSVSTNYIY